jgi:RTX calcium-binding nonapeptide repeat (4 copies)
MVDVIASDALLTGLQINGADITNAVLTGPTTGTPRLVSLSSTSFDYFVTLNTGVIAQVHCVNAKYIAFSLSTYAVSSLMFRDAQGSLLVSITDLNVARNASLPILGGLLGFFGGDDSVRGNGYADNLSLSDGDDLANGFAGTDTLIGGQGNDTLFGGRGADSLDGYLDDDRLFGGTSNDLLDGSYGNDTLFGELGRDRLIGGADDDRLYGGAGADTLDGGYGKDLLFGGNDTDRDVFVFSTITLTTAPISTHRDLIYGMDHGIDDIRLADIDANVHVSGNQAFKFGGFTARANAVWLVDTGPDMMVRVDRNGDARADFEIRVVDITTLTDADFIL